MVKTRVDLLHVAEHLAADARKSEDAEATARLATGAKAALEAAALVDLEPAPIIAAIERLANKLSLSDVNLVLDVSGPAEALEALTDRLEFAEREIKIGAAVQHGYVELRDLLLGLERDFAASDTPTAQRYAIRIHLGLEAAAEAITNAKREEVAA